MSEKTETDLLQKRARARVALNPPPGPIIKAPPICLIQNVGGITVAEDKPRMPNYEWRWAETRLCGPEGEGPLVTFERGDNESVKDFEKRVLGSLPAVQPAGRYAVAIFSSPNIVQ